MTRYTIEMRIETQRPVPDRALDELAELTGAAMRHGLVTELVATAEGNDAVDAFYAAYGLVRPHLADCGVRRVTRLVAIPSHEWDKEQK